MKKILHLIIIILILIFGINITSNAQIINICGSDTIILKAGNYQLGQIQWQESIDCSTWIAIAGENDTIYKFFPVEPKFYRVEIKYAECPPEYSEVSFVQLAPVANAGTDRVISGTSVRMRANTASNGAIGTWSISSGNEGSFDDIHDPDATFFGIDSVYNLVWSLSNSCGTSSDTIEIETVINEFYDIIVYVDATDTMISDSTQLANGQYIIKFSSPIPNITDSTVLLGLINDGFIRKVDSFVVYNDTFNIQTSQGTLMDITGNAAFNFGDAFDINPSNLKSTSAYRKLDRLPTRAEIRSDPKLIGSRCFYLGEEKVEYLTSGVTYNRSAETSDDEGIVFTVDKTIEIGICSVNINNTLRFMPRPIFDVHIGQKHCYSPPELKKMKIGMYNAKSINDFSITCTMGEEAVIKKDIDLLKITRFVLVGGIPLECKIDFGGSISVSAAAKIEASHHRIDSSSYTAGIKYYDGKWDYPFSTKNESTTTNSIALKGNLTQTFEIGPRLSFKIAGLVGPYMEAKFKEEFSLGVCDDLKNNHKGWQGNLDLGVNFSVGASAEIIIVDVFDVNKTWEKNLYHFEYPSKLIKLDGANQCYAIGEELSKDISVHAVNNFGHSVPNTKIYFEPQNGGTVGNQPVIADKNGIASTKWTPGGEYRSTLEAIAIDGEGINLEDSPLKFLATSLKSGLDCENSSLSANVKYVSPESRWLPDHFNVKATGGTLPYSYSTDGIDYSEVKPLPIVNLLWYFSTIAGKTYTYFVKDTKGCMDITSYTIKSPCNDSDLSIDIQLSGNRITVEGTGGTAPYEYKIDDTEEYNSKDYYSDVAIGNHIVYVKDKNGCEVPKSVFMPYVYPPIIASFTTNQEYVVLGNELEFYDQSNNATSWLWDFGDGTTDTISNPVHTYSDTGKYSPTLIAYNKEDSDTIVGSLIYVGEIPQADFYVSDSIVEIGTTVAFTDNSSNLATSCYNKYRWEFGYQQNAIIPNPKHYYGSTGIYTVTLTVSNEYGESTKTKMACVKVGRKPQSEFMVSKKVAAVGDSIAFTDQSTYSPKGFSWDFGDGDTATVANPVHAYLNPGGYTVKHIAMNEFGTSDFVATNYIRIGLSPIACIYVGGTIKAVGDSILFVDQSENNSSTRLWNFGDGFTSTLKGLYHSYSSEGVFTVKLTVSNEYGSDSITKSDFISCGYPSISEFKADTALIPPGYMVTFTDQSANKPTDWKWDFGDGETSTLQNPTHAYVKSGIFTVTLMATNKFNNYYNKVAFSKIINVGYTPIAQFSVNTTSAIVGTSVSFTDESANNPTEWNWDFGDGETSALQNPTHTYNESGEFTVQLKLISIFGITSSCQKVIIVTDESTTFTDARDGNTYNVVKIGNQTWMAENLAYLPKVKDPYSDDYWETTTTPEYYVYGYHGSDISEAKMSENYQNYGAYYNAMAIETAAPIGWHVPTSAEWQELLDYAANNGYAGDEGNALKSCRQVSSPLAGECATSEHPRWDSDDNYGTNAFGFSALPGGEASGEMGSIGMAGYWWSRNTDGSLVNVPNFSLYSGFAYIDIWDATWLGLSIRCIKD